MKHLLFHIDGVAEIHYNGAINDSTLCCLAYEENDDWPDPIKITSERVNCMSCKKIRNHVMGSL